MIIDEYRKIWHGMCIDKNKDENIGDYRERKT